MAVDNVASLTTISSTWANELVDEVNDIRTLADTVENEVDVIQGNNWVTTARINNGAVTEGKLASASVTRSKIGFRAVGESELDIGCVLEDHLGDFVIMPQHFREDFMDVGVATNFSGNWTGESLTYTRIGNGLEGRQFISFHFQGTLAAHGTGFTAGTLPSGYRPLGTLYFGGIDISGNAVWSASVGTTGNIELLGTLTAGHVGHVFSFSHFFYTELS